MKISITIKLFLAVLAVCCVVMLMQAMAMRISMQHGFFGYLNDESRETMRETLPRLRAAYLQHGGSWDFLDGPMHHWIDTIRPPMPHFEIPPDEEGPLPSPADLTGAVIRMGLLDEHLRRIAGNPLVNQDSLRQAVVVNGRIVGWVAMVPFEQVLAPGEARFLRDQLWMLWLIAALSVVLVALSTFLVTRTVLRRVRSLAQATRALAAGNYASRIEPGPRDELGSLAQDFNRMAQALEHNERARRSFMADISHELRTPLAVIRAEIEAIQDGIRQPTAQSLEVMHQEVGHLGKLIGDLHDLSLTDVGAQTYRMAPIDLAMVLRTAVANMQRRFDSAGLTLQANIPQRPMLVQGDENRLQQLLANLLENALRYTDAGGEVRVLCTQVGNWAHIGVADSAPGVAPEKLAHLFERFYRAEASRNRASGGSGLGLSICGNIVEAHAGHIRADASPMGGVAIHIELPLTA